MDVCIYVYGRGYTWIDSTGENEVERGLMWLRPYREVEAAGSSRGGGVSTPIVAHIVSRRRTTTLLMVARQPSPCPFGRNEPVQSPGQMKGGPAEPHDRSIKRRVVSAPL